MMRTFPVQVCLLLSLLLPAACSSTGAARPTAATTTPMPASALNVYVGTADTSPQNTVSALSGTTGKLLWRYGTGTSENTSPVLDHGVVYVGSDQSLSALRAQDGTLLWRYQTAGFAEVLGVVDGVVYGDDSFGPSYSKKASVYALNASDGSVRWHYQTSVGSVKGMVADGMIYMTAEQCDDQCYDLRFYILALNASDGSLGWQTPVADDLYTVQAEVHGRLYIVDASPHGPFTSLLVLHVSDGSVAWRFPKVPPAGSRLATIGMDGSVIYVLSNDGTVSQDSAGPQVVSALRSSDGTVIWQASIKGSVLLVATLLQQVIYLGSADGTALMALNAPDGALLWNRQISPSSTTTNVTVQAVVNGTAFVSFPQGFAALQTSDGLFKWTFQAKGSPANVAVEGGVVYAATSAPDADGTGQNVIYALDASNGTLLWRYEASLPFAPPAVG